MSEITGGELLVRALANEGVRIVFGLPCPEVDPILAALEKHEMRLVPVRHEAAGVHMAEGLYKTRGEVAAVLGNPGPGSANLLPGVITARHEGVPVVIVTAQHRLGIVYPSPPTTFQGQDQLDVFRPAVKWGAPVLEWSRIPEVVRLAFREMWLGRPGPVHIELPAPFVYQQGDPSTVPIRPPASYRAGLLEPSEPQLRAAAEMLAKAERPVVVSGSGVDRAGANEALLAVVECLGCPVIPTMAGRSTVPLDHPQRLYGYGPGADAARKEAEVILVAGSRVGNLDLPYDKYWGDPARAKVIQIDVDPRSLGVSRPIVLGIVADAKLTLERLLPLLDGKRSRDRSADLARYRQLGDSEWSRQFERVAAWKGEGIHPAHAAVAVGGVFGADAIYVADGGMSSLWSSWFLPTTRPRSYHSILELGMLGTGIPSAIGAKLAEPSREVVCVTGDGAAGFNFMEMQSAAREGLKITTVVLAEGSWTMEEPNERALFGKTFGTAMGEVRWDLVGEGLGCRGFYVDRLEALRPALESARAGVTPSVVCVKTSRDANLAVPDEMFVRFMEVYQGPFPAA